MNDYTVSGTTITMVVAPGSLFKPFVYNVSQTEDLRISGVNGTSGNFLKYRCTAQPSGTPLSNRSYRNKWWFWHKWCLMRRVGTLEQVEQVALIARTPERGSIGTSGVNGTSGTTAQYTWNSEQTVVHGTSVPLGFPCYRSN
jgi:hypothetical protein